MTSVRLPEPFRTESRRRFVKSHPLDASVPAAVYFVYNDTGDVVYIGVTYDPYARIRNHANTAPWRSEIAEWSADWYLNRRDAEYVELILISEQQPIYNVAGTPLHRAVSLRLVVPTHCGGIAAYSQEVPPVRPKPGPETFRLWREQQAEIAAER